MRVKAPAERNFRRAKVKPGKRRPWRLHLIGRAAKLLLVAVIVLYAGSRGISMALSTKVLQVRKIAVHGNVRLSTGEVEQIAHGLYGRNIISADLNAHRRALLDSPWIADASLRRVLPATIEVYISERRPFGISRLGGQLYLIDPDGVVIDEYGPQYADLDLPIIDGLVPARRNARSGIDPARARLAARVIDSLAGHTLARRLSQIDVSDAHDAVVLLDNDPAELHLGEERFRERLQSYVEVASTLRERVPDIDYVDLRFGERLYVRPRGGARKAIKPVSAF